MSLKLRSIMKASELRGKRVLLRLDLNLPIEHGKILAIDKLLRSLATVRALLERGAKVIIATHLGRPQGKKVSGLSTRPLAVLLQDTLGVKVSWVSSVCGTPARIAAAKLKNGEILLLENLRFEKGEQEDDPAFAKKFTQFADLYVNDAFAVSHHRHASVAGITEYFDSYAGLRLIMEVDHLSRLLEVSPRTLVVVMGGSKISSKIQVLERFLSIGARVLLGGALAVQCFKARGLEIGRSLWSAEEVELAERIAHSPRLYLPCDLILAQKLQDNSSVRMAPPTAVHGNEAIVDIGLEGLCEFRSIIEKARSIIWNGPLGISEIPAFAHGSVMLGRTIAKQTEYGAYSVVGGGDTLPIIAKTGMADSFSFVSTGGGAMLEFLSGKMLPGLVSLVDKS